MDVSKTIVPKSDQLNADDLLAGPITVTILAVSEGPADQPVHIKINGGYQPYKPCKSMRRVLVFAWGKFADRWVGKSMRLYCEPSVKWAGEPVGGIRISHLSDIPGDLSVMLTITKSVRKPFLVKLLPADGPVDDSGRQITDEQAATLTALFATLPEEKQQPFLDWLGKHHEGPLNTLPPGAYDKVLAMLNRGAGK